MRPFWCKAGLSGTTASAWEACLFLGQVLEARCTQFVNPTFSYVAKVRREYLPKRTQAVPNQAKQCYWGPGKKSAPFIIMSCCLMAKPRTLGK